MREKQTEQKLVKAVRNAGGLCPKFVSPGFAGMPDRLILLPGRRFAFVEVKVPGEKPRLLQLHRHAQLRALGFRSLVHAWYAGNAGRALCPAEKCDIIQAEKRPIRV